MKQFFILFSLLFISILHVNAQEDIWQKSSSWYFSMGAHGVDVNAFNNSIQNNGLASLPSTNFAVGFGWHNYDGKFIYGFDFLSHISSRVSGTQFRSRMTNINSVFILGYKLYETPHFAFYPTLGFGGGTSTFSTESIDLSASNLAGALQINSSMIALNYGVIPITLNTDFYIGKRDAKALLGLSAGYNLVFGSGSWRVNSILGGRSNARNSISGIGGFTPSGFFVTAKIGIAY